jgi:RimJ/RimL family protein N-acetyltransferase
VTADLCTPRLRLRQWCDADIEAFARINADPEVMRYFPAPGTLQGTQRSVDAWRRQINERGWSNWAVERADSGEFIGFVGLTEPARALPFTPCVEIGWRLARAHWGQGYASEAARASLAFGFDRLGLREIVSFTSVLNWPSRKVMERIGMLDTGQDFDHPALPEGSPLRRHCLYRLRRDEGGSDAAT